MKIVHALSSVFIIHCLWLHFHVDSQTISEWDVLCPSQNIPEQKHSLIVTVSLVTSDSSLVSFFIIVGPYSNLIVIFFRYDIQ